MNKYLKPSLFIVDIRVSDAADQSNHWFKTFSNFICVIDSELMTRLPILFSFLLPAIYNHIKESTSYETVVETLPKLFVKPQNHLIARHLLSNYKQDPNETLDLYLESFKLLILAATFTLTLLKIAKTSICETLLSMGYTRATFTSVYWRTRPLIWTWHLNRLIP